MVVVVVVGDAVAVAVVAVIDVTRGRVGVWV